MSHALKYWRCSRAIGTASSLNASQPESALLSRGRLSDGANDGSTLRALVIAKETANAEGRKRVGGPWPRGARSWRPWGHFGCPGPPMARGGAKKGRWGDL